MKMNETTVTETLDPVNATTTTTTITITLHPEPNKEIASDITTTIASATGETTIANMSPSSGDSDSLQNSQMLVKKSLKLDLAHNNNEIKSVDAGSPEIEDDLSFKSPTSPRISKKLSPRISHSSKCLESSINFLT